MTTLENILALQALLIALEEEDNRRAEEAIADYFGDETLQEEHTQTVAETVWG